VAVRRAPNSRRSKMEVVITAYHPDAWESFAVAEVGAAAALAGLLVVAASINISMIIKLPAVVSRLAGTLAMFTGILMIGTVLLVPDQARWLLGTEIVLLGVGMTLIVCLQHGLRQAEAGYRTPTVVMVTGGALSGITAMVAGGSLIAGAGGGLYWLLPSVLLAFGFGLVNAWVALVEILR
jgi:hypothetical protein